ncbi:hypothetical protein [Stutzerimonas tarimensis]|uniref:Glycosyltransferase n=1 Tax=Stutzerimonas tarimensis TaxID=1507735 RepID=A0ABV7T6R1_9GAMM
MKSSARPLRIGYLPFSPDENTYVARMKHILQGFAEVVEAPDLKKLRTRPLAFFRERYDVVILNWTDNRLASHHTGKASPLGFAKFVAEALAVRLTTRKIIFVRHNNYPHHANADSGKFISRTLDRLSSLFDLVITHSAHEPESRKHYVPHPLYAIQPPAEAASAGDYFVVFGRILRYKRILELIEAFPADRKLVIAGACLDNDYLAQMRAAAQGKDVEIRAGFIEDAAARDLVGRSAGLIICNAEDDMVVSGSYFYAVSLGASVLALRTPFLDWLSSRLKFPGLRVYATLDEMCQGLDDAIPADPQAVIRSGHQHFGEHRIADCWKAALARIGLEPKAQLAPHFRG